MSEPTASNPLITPVEVFNDEPAGDWGWYNDDGSAGYHITNLRAKGINRYSGDKLVELKICKHKHCVC